MPVEDEISLVQAVKNSNLKAVKALTGTNCDAKRDPEILKVAIRKGHIKILEILLNNGMSARKKCKSGRSPIFYAVITGNLDILKILVGHGALPEDSPNLLSTACKVNVVEIVEFLIQLGAKSDVAGAEKPPLFYAVKNSNIKVMKLLISCEAEIKPEVLRAAIKESSLEAIGVLLDNGADPNAIGNAVVPPDTKVHSEKEALPDDFLYWDEDFLAQVSKLSTNCSKDDFFPGVKAVTAQIGGTALHVAADSDRKDALNVVSLLLKYGADPNIVSPEGVTPLIVATVKGQVSIVRVLLDHDAKWDFADSSGRTAFHFAAKLGKADILRSLYDYSFLQSERLAKSGIFQVLVVRRELFAVDFDKKQREWKQFVNLTARHLLKMRAVGLKVDAENSTAFQCCSSEQLKKFMLLCKAEVAKLKREFIAGAKVNLFDILTKDECEVAVFLENDEVFRAFQARDFETEYSTYGAILEVQFFKGLVRKNLVDQGVKSGPRLLNLPERPMRIIFRYLSNQDLRALMQNL